MAKCRELSEKNHWGFISFISSISSESVQIPKENLQMAIETFMDKIKNNGAQLAQKAQKLEVLTEPELPLIIRVESWLARLPEDQRGLAYPMEFFTKRFCASSMALGPVLSELQFKRERVYSKHGPHRRIWLLPE
jgi:hypothetical protein